MAAVDFAIVLVYMAGMIGIGFAVSRRIRVFRDYFVAAGRLTTPLLICTLVSTYYGLDVLFGGSEVSYQEGVVAWFAYTRPYYVVILIAAVFVARRLRRHDFLSLPDVAGHFYGNGARAAVAVASALYSVPIMALMGIGVLLDVVLGVPFVWGVLLGAAVALAYTVLGGLLAGALTDTIQFTLMCVTLGVAAILAMNAIGGADAMQEVLPASYFDPTGTYPAWVILVFAASALSALVEPAFYQRVFAAVNYRAVLLALLASIVLWAAFDWITTIMGMAAAAMGLDTEPRYALLTVTLDLLPVGLTGLFVAGVLATAMSTIDAYLLIAGGNLSYDLYRPLVRPAMDDRSLLRLTRWMIVVASILSVVLALFFQTIVSAWIFMSTVLIATALVPLLAGLYARGPTVPAAGLASSVTGLGVATLIYVLVHLFGHFDEEWATQIWAIQLGERSFDLWQEYALLLALPASAVAYLIGHVTGRKPRDPALARPRREAMAGADAHRGGGPGRQP